MFYILMKFGADADLIEIIRMQKKNQKNSNYIQSYDCLKNAIFGHSALFHILKAFLLL